MRKNLAALALLLGFCGPAQALDACCQFFSPSHLYLYYVYVDGVPWRVYGIHLNPDGSYELRDTDSTGPLPTPDTPSPTPPADWAWAQYDTATGILSIPSIYVDKRRYDNVTLYFKGGRWEYLAGSRTEVVLP